MDYFKGVITEMSSGTYKGSAYFYDSIKIGSRVLDKLMIDNKLREILEAASLEKSEIGIYTTHGIILGIEKDGKTFITKYIYHIMYFILLVVSLLLCLIAIGFVIIIFPLILISRTHSMRKFIKKIPAKNPIYLKATLPPV